jgi:hypothetical protein
MFTQNALSNGILISKQSQPPSSTKADLVVWANSLTTRTKRIKTLKTIQRGNLSEGTRTAMFLQGIEMCGDLCDFGGELCGLVGFSGVRFEEISMFLTESFEFTFEI